jgi:hypothetical protein
MQAEKLAMQGRFVNEPAASFTSGEKKAADSSPLAGGFN